MTRGNHLFSIINLIAEYVFVLNLRCLMSKKICSDSHRLLIQCLFSLSLSLIDAQYQSPVFDNRLGCLLYPCHNSWRLADNGNIYANFDGDSGLLPVSGDHWSREFF